MYLSVIYVHNMYVGLRLFACEKKSYDIFYFLSLKMVLMFVLE